MAARLLLASHQLRGAVSARPNDDQGTQPVLLEADVEVDPVGAHVDEVAVVHPPFGEGAGLGLPAGGEPGEHRGAQSGGGAENPASAGAKSPGLILCRYINGSALVTLGHLWAHGGKMGDRNGTRSPVSVSARLSLTRGAHTSIRPAAPSSAESAVPG